MFTYEPLKALLRDHNITYYDLHKTGLPHGTIYAIKNDQTVSLPTINYIMYVFNLNSIDQVLKYYRDGEEVLPTTAHPLENVDKVFEKLNNKK